MINQQQQYIPILLAFSIGLLLGVSLNQRGSSVNIRDINSREDNNDHNNIQQHRQLLSEFGLSTQSLRDPKSISARDIQPLVRDVHVGTMCRCGGSALAVPGQMTENGIDTNIHQPPSLATGNQYNHYILHPPTSEENGGCTCIQDSIYAEPSTDKYLNQISQDFYNKRCPANEQAYASNLYNWNTMPDFGVEESLPVFLGVLSYESPLSLNGTLHNWMDNDLFRRINAQDVMVQLNHRSAQDDQILNDFNNRLASVNQPPVSVMGSSEDNLNPGVAIAKYCRAAEAHPNSHPTGQNLLLFLEKDWNIISGDYQERHIEQLFYSINALSQRGVPYFRLNIPVQSPKRKAEGWEGVWQCPSQGVPWMCTTSHHHRWTNTPLVLDCQWFLRYLEPFALMSSDPIMTGCGRGFQSTGYCDWEEAMQDGRIAWTNSQWVVAHISHHQDRPRLFVHKEVDQESPRLYIFLYP